MKSIQKTLILLSVLIICPMLFAQSEEDVNSVDYKAYSNFDFIAGTKTIFYDDFTSSTNKWKIIEFDPSEDIEKPGIKKIEGNDNSWFKVPKHGIFYPLNLKTLPEHFTIEFDMWADDENMSEMESGLIISIVGNKVIKDEYSIHFDENPQVQIDIHPSLELLYCSAVEECCKSENRVLVRKDIKNGWKAGKVHRISISRNKTHIKLYVDEKKFIDLPQGLPKSQNYTLMLATNMWGDGLYLTDFKIAEVVNHTITKIDEHTKFVTNAIYFNVNSAVVKPESWPALNQAATAIKSTQGIVTIIGHTDSDGHDADNLLLSKKRAESVKELLVKNFGIDSSRLQTDGKGESEPIDSNNSPEGKANNRRVEFIKKH